MSNNKNPQIKFAIQLLMSNQGSTAQKICQEVLISDPFNADAHDLLGVISSQKKNWDQALLLLEMLLKAPKNMIIQMLFDFSYTVQRLM